MSDENLYLDAYQPQQIARRVASMGVAKAEANTLTLLVLAVLAGAFMSLGALFFTLIITNSNLGFGITRLLGGLGFCTGVALVVIGGAEVFTSNNLLAMAWASKLISTKQVLRNWLLVYLGNTIGCLGMVALVWWSDIGSLASGAVATTSIEIATEKANLSAGAAFARGILCNTLVCLAVWLSMGGHTVTDKILAILLPISAFIAIGFEHAIANWFFLPYGILLAEPNSVLLAGAAHNLIVVSAGNIVGGTLLVAGVYWLAYLRETA
ncbi:MAG: formate/nitrite transporter family protein [Betaproteobacteria bacterium]|nr:MAG: formate/nitrite transporter family protein [Betaproteobacteria bacterium]